MGTITINGKKVEFTDEKNVLTIIRKAGIDMPTLCYHSELSTFGACRLCTVENDRGQCFASCSEEPRDGMVIYTHTERLRRHRKLIVELLLAAHCRDCTTCVKSGECVLQDLAHKMGIREVRFQDYKELKPVDYSSPAIVRDPNKCILCGNCVRVCSEIQGVGVLGFLAGQEAPRRRHPADGRTGFPSEPQNVRYHISQNWNCEPAGYAGSQYRRSYSAEIM